MNAANARHLSSYSKTLLCRRKSLRKNTVGNGGAKGRRVNFLKPKRIIYTYKLSKSISVNLFLRTSMHYCSFSIFRIFSYQLDHISDIIATTIFYTTNHI